MRGMWRYTKRVFTQFWKGLRDWCGDAAYENYRTSAARRGQQQIVSPSQFYVEQLHRKYSRPNRCC
jgi:Selenoprotein, putative